MEVCNEKDIYTLSYCFSPDRCIHCYEIRELAQKKGYRE